MQQRLTPRRVVRFSILIFLPILLCTYSISAPGPVKAYITPTSAADAVYVDNSWDDSIVFNQITTIQAYANGYNANTGSPTNHIILGFGAQQYDTSQGWGVRLPLISTYHTNQWVRNVAEEYMKGYVAGHSQSVIVAIGTSNYNPTWPCSNDYTTLSSRWRESGIKWGELVTQITAPSRVSVRSANDIEAWTNYVTGWRGCSMGAKEWYRGFESVTTKLNSFFGSNNAEEDTTYWTFSALYSVTFGFRSARAFPQIYCPVSNVVGPGRSTPGQPYTGWIKLISQYPSMFYSGVTSEDGASTICNGTRTLSWNESWDALNNSLVQASFLDKLYRVVSSFFIHSPT